MFLWWMLCLTHASAHGDAERARVVWNPRSEAHGQWVGDRGTEVLRFDMRPDLDMPGGPARSSDAPGLGQPELELPARIGTAAVAGVTLGAEGGKACTVELSSRPLAVPPGRGTRLEGRVSQCAQPASTVTWQTGAAVVDIASKTVSGDPSLPHYVSGFMLYMDRAEGSGPRQLMGMGLTDVALNAHRSLYGSDAISETLFLLSLHDGASSYHSAPGMSSCPRGYVMTGVDARYRDGRVTALRAVCHEQMVLHHQSLYSMRAWSYHESKDH